MSDSRVRLSGGFIGALGVVLSLVQFRPLLGHGDAPSVMSIPVVFALGLVALGALTTRGRLVSDEDALRLAGWTVAGMAIFSLVGLWILVLERAFGQATPYALSMTANAVTLGGIVGAGIGLYDSRIREQARALERRERELVDQNERLDEFASVVSHDLRNPLEVAQIRLELAEEEGLESDHVSIAMDALDRMSRIIDETLTLAREGRDVGQQESVSLRDVAEECWRNVDTGDATMVIDGDVTVDTDADRLTRLFENLFRNAVEHGRPDVTVRVGTCEGGFFVEDDGPGIPPEERDSVFESGYTSSPDGTGFGLAIVDRIAGGHGWDVRVTDGTDGGARFEFTGVDRAS